MKEGLRVRVTANRDSLGFPGTVVQVVDVSDQSENVHVLFDDGYYWIDAESNIQHADEWFEEKDLVVS